jgi:hypothetical protein
MGVRSISGLPIISYLLLLRCIRSIHRSLEYLRKQMSQIHILKNPSGIYDPER